MHALIDHLLLGADANGEPSVQSLRLANRHGLIAGATGTGKTVTLQRLAEQFSDAGVAVFAADIKGDLSGIATPGEGGDKLAARTTSIGQDWQATAFPTEFLTLGGQGTGVPIRTTITSFGPTLLSKVLGLNATQESSLGLIFHFADKQGLALLDLKDLRAVVQHLVSDEGKAELKALGGLSSATAGVILRELITFADDGAIDVQSAANGSEGRPTKPVKVVDDEHALALAVADGADRGGDLLHHLHRHDRRAVVTLGQLRQIGLVEQRRAQQGDPHRGRGEEAGCAAG